MRNRKLLLFFVFLLIANNSFADVVVYQAGKMREENQMLQPEKLPDFSNSSNADIPATPQELGINAPIVIKEYKGGSGIKLTSPQKPQVILKSSPDKPSGNFASPEKHKKINYNEAIETDINAHPVSSVNSANLGEKPQFKSDCDENNFICINSYTYKDYIEIEVKNNSYSARTVTISYNLTNMRAEFSSANKNIVLKPSEAKRVERLWPINTAKSYGFNYNFKPYLGVMDAVADDYYYDLPFDIGNKFIVIQGVGGKFTHNTDELYYSYDFKMPIGTPVLAARDGIVVKIVDKFKEGGTNTAFKNRANFVYIQHSDGTIASYNHLKYNGSLVSEGAYVQKGQQIALSGNTGYTTTPHLHFGVFKVVKGGKYKSVPIKIKTSEGVLNQLKAGGFYSK